MYCGLSRSRDVHKRWDMPCGREEHKYLYVTYVSIAHTSATCTSLFSAHVTANVPSNNMHAGPLSGMHMSYLFGVHARQQHGGTFRHFMKANSLVAASLDRYSQFANLRCCHAQNKCQLVHVKVLRMHLCAVLIRCLRWRKNWPKHLTIQTCAKRVGDAYLVIVALLFNLAE